MIYGENDYRNNDYSQGFKRNGGDDENLDKSLLVNTGILFAFNFVVHNVVHTLSMKSDAFIYNSDDSKEENVCTVREEDIAHIRGYKWRSRRLLL